MTTETVQTLTVGELRRNLEGLDDNMPVVVEVGNDAGDDLRLYPIGDFHTSFGTEPNGYMLSFEIRPEGWFGITRQTTLLPSGL